MDVVSGHFSPSSISPLLLNLTDIIKFLFFFLSLFFTTQSTPIPPPTIISYRVVTTLQLYHHHKPNIKRVMISPMATDATSSSLAQSSITK